MHFGGDHMTTVSSWMQDAFESAREEAMAIHARLHDYFHARATLTIGLNEEPQLPMGNTGETAPGSCRFANVLTPAHRFAIEKMTRV